jgi:type IV pilus biogenesis protein CpaD/CtpE
MLSAKHDGCLVPETLTAADRDRIIAYLKRQAEAFDQAATILQPDEHNTAAAERLRGDAAALRRAADILREDARFEG